jgi:hypothetical protein
VGTLSKLRRLVLRDGMSVLQASLNAFYGVHDLSISEF